jgi:membrane protein
VIEKALKFIRVDVWKLRTASLDANRAAAVKWLKIVLLAARGFRADRLQLRATALTLYSLISVVPILALAFAIAKGFGYEQRLEQQILEQVPQQEVILTRVLEFSRRLLANTESGLIAGVGVVLLLWTVIKVFGNIEQSFNDIWRIRDSRPLVRKLSDYLSLMLVCPVLLILSSSGSVFLSSEAARLRGSSLLGDAVGTFITIVLNGFPWVITWVLFTFIYLFMPNTRVRWSSALWAGLLLGTVYQFVQWGYLELQIGVSRYNAIYGSFAALPLFVIWLQISWLIVLVGAEVSFAHQNFRTYEYGPEPMTISYRARKLLALRIMHMVTEAFVADEEPPTSSAISEALELPSRLTTRVLGDLQAAGLAAEVRPVDGNDPGYQPARDPSQLTVGEVIARLEGAGESVAVPDSRELDELSRALEEFRDAAENSPANRLLTEL